MFRYLADAPLFEECLTRRKLPVRMVGDYLALERQYTAVRRTPGEPILAALDGQIAERAGMEGPPRPPLLVERFANLWPGEMCGARFATERWENTYWTLVRLRNEPIVVAPDQREPHIVPHAEDRRIARPARGAPHEVATCRAMAEDNPASVPTAWPGVIRSRSTRAQPMASWPIAAAGAIMKRDR
jgi:hypothetical protein